VERSDAQIGPRFELVGQQMFEMKKKKVRERNDSAP
jgi:hypothetical protein